MDPLLVAVVIGAPLCVITLAILLLRPSGAPRVFDTWSLYEGRGHRDSASGRAVLRRWRRDLAALEREGLAFMVPGRGHVVKEDDVATWEAPAAGIPHRRLVLRVDHNDPMRDLDYDAVAFVFANAADREAFRANVPAGGPTPFVFADTLSPSTRALHDRLMARPR